MDKFLPDIYQKSIYTIDYSKLKKSGIQCLIFGLNNTISPFNIKTPTKKMKDLIEELKDMNFKIIIVSNASKKRVEPFKELLNVDAAYRSYKPLKNKYMKIIKLFGFKDTQIACIGDQFFTDIYAANRLGFTSILVNPVSLIDRSSMKITSILENIIANYFIKREKLERGHYYE